MTANTSDYCHAIEAYLCRKNDGHLIRIVGPAFEQVSGWAARGVPLKVAFRGIDRYFERYYAKGPRRRPVRIEFCEADVLDAFDAWRRAVGVIGTATVEDTGPDADSPRARTGGLQRHIDRALARLTAWRAGTRLPDDLDRQLDALILRVDGLRGPARSARGEARAALVGELAQADDALIAIARATLDADAARALSAEAEEQLRPFRERMNEPDYRQAVQACAVRCLRERLDLPDLEFG